MSEKTRKYDVINNFNLYDIDGIHTLHFPMTKEKINTIFHDTFDMSIFEDYVYSGGYRGSYRWGTDMRDITGTSSLVMTFRNIRRYDNELMIMLVTKFTSYIAIKRGADFLGKRFHTILDLIPEDRIVEMLHQNYSGKYDLQLNVAQRILCSFSLPVVKYVIDAGYRYTNEDLQLLVTILERKKNVLDVDVEDAEFLIEFISLTGLDLSVEVCLCPTGRMITCYERIVNLGYSLEFAEIFRPRVAEVVPKSVETPAETPAIVYPCAKMIDGVGRVTLLDPENAVVQNITVDGLKEKQMKYIVTGDVITLFAEKVEPKLN